MSHVVYSNGLDCPPCAAPSSQAPGLVRTVLQHGARVNTPRGDRRIPLHTAMRLPAGQKKLAIVATLLVVGADIDRPGACYLRYYRLPVVLEKKLAICAVGRR